jgi:hypothetical protein
MFMYLHELKALIQLTAPAVFFSAEVSVVCCKAKDSSFADALL